MKILKKFGRDNLYNIVLKDYEGCSEYLLVDANDSDKIFAILEEEEIINNGK